jgi:osmotically-inducible protein OsmY
MAGEHNNHKKDGTTGARLRSAPDVPSDEQIRENVEAHLQHASQRFASDVMVEVNGGYVTLIGEVPHSVMKQQIGDMAASCPGVRHVDNKLTVPLTAPWPDSP